MPSSRGSSRPRMEPKSLMSPAFGRRVLHHQCYLGSPKQSIPYDLVKCIFDIYLFLPTWSLKSSETVIEY